MDELEKRKKGWQDLRMVNFVVNRQLCIVTPVAYWRDPYKKRATFLTTPNRGHIIRYKILNLIQLSKGHSKSNGKTYRRCHEKTSYVSNDAFFTVMHKWVNRGQTHHFEKLQNYIFSYKLELHIEEFL